MESVQGVFHHFSTSCLDNLPQTICITHSCSLINNSRPWYEPCSPCLSLSHSTCSLTASAQPLLAPYPCFLHNHLTYSCLTILIQSACKKNSSQAEDCWHVSNEKRQNSVSDQPNQAACSFVRLLLAVLCAGATIVPAQTV